MLRPYQGPKRPHEHKDLTFWFKGLIQGGCQKSCVIGSLSSFSYMPHTIKLFCECEFKTHVLSCTNTINHRLYTLFYWSLWGLATEVCSTQPCNYGASWGLFLLMDMRFGTRRRMAPWEAKGSWVGVGLLLGRARAVDAIR